MTFIAIICGLKSEAQSVAAALGAAQFKVGVSGANAQRAEKIAGDFCNEGAKAIVSIGVSGALDPSLRPGDLIIGDRVITSDGSVWASDLALLKSVLTSPAGAAAKSGSLFGADDIVAGAQDKAALFAKHACLAVDMESHGAARAAARAGTPFIAIRAITDPANYAMPKAALGAVAEDGSIRIFTTLGAALRDPAQIPALIKLGLDSGAALKTLRSDLVPLFNSLFVSLDF